MLCNYRQNLVLIVLSSIVSVQSVPKFDEAGWILFLLSIHHGFNKLRMRSYRFVPSSFSFLNKAAKAQDQIAMPSSHVNVKPDEPTKRIAPDTNEISDRNHDPRFGFTSVGTTGSVNIIIFQRCSNKMKEGNILGICCITLCRTGQNRLGWFNFRCNFRSRFDSYNSKNSLLTVRIVRNVCEKWVSSYVISSNHTI